MSGGVALVSMGASVSLHDPDAGWIVTSMDVGAPQVRGNSSDRPDNHGTIDRTRLAGARAVSLSVAAVTVPSSLRRLVDDLAPLCEPGRRSILIVDYGGDIRYLNVRVGELPTVWDNPGRMILTVPLVTVGSPFWLSFAQHASTLTPIVGAADAGLHFSAVAPFVFDDENEGETGLVNNAGTTSAYWTAQIEGPVQDVQIRNVTTGQTVALTGLMVTSGQTLIVDSETRTVTLDGESRYAAVDTAISDWWTLPPGVSMIDAPTTSSSAPARMSFRWNDTYYL